MQKSKIKNSTSAKAAADTQTLDNVQPSKEETPKSKVATKASTSAKAPSVAKALETKTADKSKSASEPQTMEELLAQTGYHLKSVKRGDLVDSKVISVSPRSLLLDLGGKGEGVVHEREIPHITDLLRSLKAGDTISVAVVNTENDRGQVVVSLRKTALTKRWELLQKHYQDKAALEVVVKELGKGGFLVDYQGLRGFIPLSQSDPDLGRTGDRASGRRIRVHVIELDQATNRLVFSQTVEATSEKLKNVEIGKSYPAEISGIVGFGAFSNVTIGPNITLPGLIHISEIAWEKVENPGDYLKIGQKLDVKVIGADSKTGKLTLSIKQLLDDPWQDVTKVLSVEQTVPGKVTRLTPYGVFISLLPGIEGLVHISKLAPGEEPKVGDEVECNIEEINPDRRKISLSLISSAKPIGYR